MKLKRCGRYWYLVHHERIAECTPLEGWSTESIEEMQEDFAKGPPFRTGALRFAYECLTITQHPLTDLETSSLGPCANKRCKIKVNNLSVQEACAQIVSTYALSGYPVRIDCNRGWTQDTVKELLESVPRSYIDYIEEPTPSYEVNHALTHIVPIALDETLLHDLEKVKEPGAFVFVLKPTLLGPIEPILHMHPARAVLSGAYESGVGTRYILNLAKEYPIIEPGIGIGTYSKETDPIEPPLLEGETPTWDMTFKEGALV